jgi:hypothetical protein
MDAATAIWIALGGNAVFLAVVAFLGKSIITHWLNKDIERFKSDIRGAADIELAKLRGALEIAANEHSILLSRLQDNRAKVIDELYGRLAAAIEAMTRYLGVFGSLDNSPTEEKAKGAAEAINAFVEYFDQKRVWLPPECCAKVETLKQGLRQRFVEFDVNRGFGVKSGKPFSDEWRKLWSDVTQDLVPPAREALESEMRRLLEPRQRET